MGNKRPIWIENNIPTALADSSMFVFKVRFLNNTEQDIDILADLDIDYDLLEEHLEQIPAQYMYWAAVYSELKSATTMADIKVTKRRAALSTSTLDEFKKKGVKLTDKQLMYVIEQDAVLIRCQAELAMAQKNTGKVYHMLEAIRMRSEHCRSLAGFKRQDKEQSSFQT